MSDKITLTSEELEAAMERAIRRSQEPPPSKLEESKRKLTEFTRSAAEFGAEHGLSAGDVLALAAQMDEPWEPSDDDTATWSRSD